MSAIDIVDAFKSAIFNLDELAEKVNFGADSLLQYSIVDNDLLLDRPPRTFYHRGTMADHGVIGQVFQLMSYSLKGLARESDINCVYNSILESGKRPLIIDAGGNIGAAAVYYALKYPGSLVVSIEPDIKNYYILQLNTQELDIENYRAAIGPSMGEVNVVDPGLGEWGYRTQIAETGDCPMLSISELIKLKIAEGCTPFILKVDIEGFERELFDQPNDWFEPFSLICVEPHDWMLPKGDTARTFLECHLRTSRDLLIQSENLLSIRNFDQPT